VPCWYTISYFVEIEAAIAIADAFIVLAGDMNSLSEKYIVA
jgi:hypothetical protein